MFPGDASHWEVSEAVKTENRSASVLPSLNDAEDSPQKLNTPGC